MTAPPTWPRVMVFAIERLDDGWHPVVEWHENCLGTTHDACTVLWTAVGPAAATPEQAEAAARSTATVMEARLRLLNVVIPC